MVDVQCLQRLVSRFATSIRVPLFVYEHHERRVHLFVVEHVLDRIDHEHIVGKLDDDRRMRECCISRLSLIHSYTQCVFKSWVSFVIADVMGVVPWDTTPYGSLSERQQAVDTNSQTFSLKDRIRKKIKILLNRDVDS